MWDRISSGDIEQAKHGLNLRRAETLSRHAEEIKALDAERTEVDELASAITKFMSKFGEGIASSDAPTASGAKTPEEDPAQANNPEVDREPVTEMGVNFRHYG